jgi:5-methylthioribose kinase
MTAVSIPEGYQAQTAQTLPQYLSAIPAVSAQLGGTPEQWQVNEVGDGNLNLVFIVRGPRGGLAIKQALPYVRLVGESWPLPLSRAHYEHMALTIQAEHTASAVPQIHHYDPQQALVAMELLEPHIIMRRGMIQGIEYPRFAADIGAFAARTLYFTSDLAVSAADKKTLIAAFSGNTALCKITEDLIFTEPYMVAANNRWTSPQLDSFAARVRADYDLKSAISQLKIKFMSSAEALLHGDLHTGSIMLTPDDTRVIDPEFAFVGPMGFDLGAVIANLLISYFSQDGHESTAGDRDRYRAWILQATEEFWTVFDREFQTLWRRHPTGDAYPIALFDGPLGAARLDNERRAYMHRLWRDTLGFAGAKMTRRVLGLAHNIDLEWIQDANRRATCEARVLTLARELAVNPDTFRNMSDVASAAMALRDWQPDLEKS